MICGKEHVSRSAYGGDPLHGGQFGGQRFEFCMKMRPVSFMTLSVAYPLGIGPWCGERMKLLTRPNHALQRTRPSRSGCNPRVPRAGSLSLGRSTARSILGQLSSNTYMKTIRNTPVLTVLLVAATFATLGFIVAGAVLTASASDKPTVPPPVLGDASPFQDATNIVFTRFVAEKHKDERFVVSDPKPVRKVVSSIHLAPGVELRDVHIYSATFQRPSGEIIVSFCPRCFTIVDSQKPYRYRHYAMPKGFYAEFRNLARQHGWSVERK